VARPISAKTQVKGLGRASVDAQTILAFADRFIGAIERGDADAVRACYAPDARIWHNTDKREQTVEQSLRSIDWFARKLPERKYRVQHREALKDGFLQQHVLEAVLPDGTAWSLNACVVARMQNGVIVRLDEYLDSAEAAALSNLGR
jgi:ketosteroid isomerase-like protein